MTALLEILLGVNNKGWVTGLSNLAGDQNHHAFLWVKGVKMDLGTLGGPNSAGSLGTRCRIRIYSALTGCLSQKCCALAQASRRALFLGCSGRSFSICVCSSVAMFFLAFSKLLPWTVIDRLLQSPFHPSSSDQKSHSTGMLAVTCRFTT